MKCSAFTAEKAFLAKRMHCQCGVNTTNTRRCVALFVTLGLRPRKANASAKRMHCQDFYREDAKGSTAKSVRDRFTALLRSMCDASVGLTLANAPEPKATEIRNLLSRRATRRGDSRTSTTTRISRTRTLPTRNRTLTRNGDVPISSSVQERATRGKSCKTFFFFLVCGEAAPFFCEAFSKTIGVKRTTLPRGAGAA